MKKWALITGPTSGIGFELAKLLAADQFNLALVSRSEDRLAMIAEEFRSNHGIEARVIAKDLIAQNAAKVIFAALRDITVSVLVNNAGFGFYGSFANSQLCEQIDMMQVNMVALVQLTHLFLPGMLDRGSGRILNVASTAAFQPGPWVNVYYASKAFVYSFTYALAKELKDTSVTVTALCPGTTQTKFFERGGFGSRRAPFTMNARIVAEAGYRGMMCGKRVVIPGVMNKISSAVAKRLPVSVTAGIAGWLNMGKNL